MTQPGIDKTNNSYLQIATIHVRGQPVIGDQEKVIRIDLCGLVHQDRVCHIRQTAAHHARLRIMVANVARVRAGSRHLSGHQRSTISLRDRVH